MNIVLVTRGSHGDVYPYFNIAKELEKRGHEVILSIPKLFEHDVKQYQLNHVLQDFEDITGMTAKADAKSSGVKVLLDWVRDSIDKQFEQLLPIVEKSDLLIAANTEFAASSIAEYCQKPLIRTAYAPFLPGKSISPPIFPFPKAPRIMIPFLWKILNYPTDLMMAKSINRNRKSLGMKPMKNLTTHLPANAHNVLLYSQSLGSIDPSWEWKWKINGYCFNDNFHYEKEAHDNLMRFVDQDDRPVIFFTLGSCNSKKKGRFVSHLSQIIKEKNYKLIIGSGWSKDDADWECEDHVFRLDKAIPHYLLLPKCTGVIHHGGSGTTHNVARYGIPQMILPLFIDQHYWGYQVEKLGLGPGYANIGKISKEELEKKVDDLVHNPLYKKNASAIHAQIQQENATDKFCDFISNYLV